ncbi:MAG: hypothetical protein KDE58_24590 [Caldilineaceae bacterium]|nr:hypothetical protein [Caldilineaceae bacterium]
MEKLLTIVHNAYKANKQDERSMVERSVSFLLLGLICVFALNSIGNVQKYVSHYHQHWTGDALGIAFGTVVFVCAYIAATTHGNPRWVAIVIGSVFGIASAYFQTNLYTSEGMQLSTALALSYIPILAGEVGLALLESLYSKQHREQHMAEITAQFQAQLQGKDAQITALQAELEAAQQQLAAFDTHPQIALPETILHAVAEKLPQLLVANGHLHGANGTNPPSEPSQMLGDLEVANDARAALKQQRKAAIPEILAAAETALSTGELATQLKIVYGWKVSTDSIRRYCQELMEEKVLESINRKWQLITS